MKETRNQIQGLIEAEQNVAEAERVIKTTSPLLIERLMEITDNDAELVGNLMKDVANLAGNAGTLAVANRRRDAEKYKDNDQHDLHPGKMSARQESLLFGTQGTQPILSAIEKIK